MRSASYLLDTHILLWLIFESRRINSKVKSIISKSDLFINSATLWEIAIKYRSGKLNLGPYTPLDLIQLCSERAIRILPISEDIAASSFLLTADFHRDPFDRILIWHAIRDELTLITNDKQIHQYSEDGLKILW